MVPEILVILGNRYSLCGVISFKKPIGKTSIRSIGHYTAEIKSSNLWTEFDDMKKATQSSNPRKTVTIAAVLYVKL